MSATITAGAATTSMMAFDKLFNDAAVVADWPVVVAGIAGIKLGAALLPWSRPGQPAKIEQPRQSLRIAQRLAVPR